MRTCGLFSWIKTHSQIVKISCKTHTAFQWCGLFFAFTSFHKVGRLLHLKPQILRIFFFLLFLYYVYMVSLLKNGWRCPLAGRGVGEVHWPFVMNKSKAVWDQLNSTNDVGWKSSWKWWRTLVRHISWRNWSKSGTDLKVIPRSSKDLRKPQVLDGIRTRIQWRPRMRFGRRT